ncbi:MAG: bleomycin resistance protein [Beijerinckiaceae bacterium]
MTPKLIPELDVARLDRSLAFYVDLIGFSIRYQRPEERFAYLALNDIHLMLEEAAGPGRRFHSAPLEYPFGRGVNFQIEVENVDLIHGRLLAAGFEMLIPLEEKWYRRDETEVGNRQFVVADPDGYLLRFFSDIGERPIAP